MMPLLLCIVITALLVNGLQIVTGDGMLLEWVKIYLDKVFIKSHSVEWYKDADGRWIKETKLLAKPAVSNLYYPILYCIKCMPSIYGTIICLLFLPFTIHLLYLIPIVIICSSALATILHTQYL